MRALRNAMLVPPAAKMRGSNRRKPVALLAVARFGIGSRRLPVGEPREGNGCADGNRRPYRISVRAREHFPASRMRHRIEAAVRRVASRNWFEQIARHVGGQHLIGELPAIARMCQVTVDEFGSDTIARIALTVGKPIQVCRRGWKAAKKIALAGISG